MQIYLVLNVSLAGYGNCPRSGLGLASYEAIAVVMCMETQHESSSN